MNANLNELEPIILEKLASDGIVSFSSHGTSMMPMLRDGKDSIDLIKKPDKIRKYDVIFYKRDDGHFVLHRVVKVCKDNTFILRGDNQYIKEKGVRYDNVIAILKSFTRKGKKYNVNQFKYKLYSHFWVNTVYIRKLLHYIKSLFRKLFSKK